jgi:hypothetical protein
MATIGLMEGAYFVSKNEILQFINSTLELRLTKVEETASGCVACQLLDIMYPGAVSMSKLDWSAKKDHEWVHNYKILQTAFTKLKINRHIDVDRLIQGKYMDNLEFMQWFKRVSVPARLVRALLLAILTCPAPSVLRAASERQGRLRLQRAPGVGQGRGGGAVGVVRVGADRARCRGVAGLRDGVAGRGAPEAPRGGAQSGLAQTHIGAGVRSGRREARPREQQQRRGRQRVAPRIRRAEAGPRRGCPQRQRVAGRNGGLGKGT